MKNFKISYSITITILIFKNSKYFLNSNSKKNFPNLIHLSIIDCNLNSKNQIFQNFFKILQYLDLSFNPIGNSNFLNMNSYKSLLILNISYTYINRLTNNDFKYCKNLIELKIIGCKLKFIEKYSIKGLISLEKLIFYDTNLPIEAFHVKSLIKLEFVIGNQFFLCCQLKEYLNRSVNCKPSRSLYESCNRFIGSKFIQLFCWFFGFIGVILNTFSLFYSSIRILKSKYFRVLLSIGDVFTSCFLLLLAIIDEFYSNSYLIENKRIKNSFVCQLLGTIMNFSILLSIISMLLITIERYIAIIDPFKTGRFFKNRKLLSIFILKISLFFSIIPFFFEKVNKYFFFF